jgi:hypothetical protein
MVSLASTSVISQALALRAWAIQVFASTPGPPPSANVEAWQLFLRAERCAVPLRARLGAFPAGSPLEARFDAEIQHVLSARAMLHRVERALGAVGARGVALKGAVPLLGGGEPLDLRDLDVLIAPASVAAVGEALAADGLDVSHDLADNVPVNAPGGWERAVRGSAGTIQVELHIALPYVQAEIDPEGVPPAPGFRHVAALPAEIHLRHVLIHGVEHHPLRRGMLRELLLLAQAVEGCTPEARAAVRHWAAAQPTGALLLRAMDAATGLAHGEPDRFAAEAALRYQLLDPRSRRGERVHSWLSFASFALLAGGREYRRLWWGTAWSPWGAGVTHSLAGIRDPLKPLRFGWRGAQLLAVTPGAWAAARGARPAAASG